MGLRRPGGRRRTADDPEHGPRRPERRRRGRGADRARRAPARPASGRAIALAGDLRARRRSCVAGAVRGARRREPRARAPRAPSCTATTALVPPRPRRRRRRGGRARASAGPASTATADRRAARRRACVRSRRRRRCWPPPPATASRRRAVPAAVTDAAGAAGRRRTVVRGGGRARARRSAAAALLRAAGLARSLGAAALLGAGEGATGARGVRAWAPRARTALARGLRTCRASSSLELGRRCRRSAPVGPRTRRGGAPWRPDAGRAGRRASSIPSRRCDDRAQAAGEALDVGRRRDVEGAHRGLLCLHRALAGVEGAGEGAAHDRVLEELLGELAEDVLALSSGRGGPAGRSRSSLVRHPRPRQQARSSR